MNRFLVAIALVASVADARMPFAALPATKTALPASSANALATVPGLAVRGGFGTKAVAKNVIIGASSFLLLPLTRDIVATGKVGYATSVHGTPLAPRLRDARC